MRHEHMWMISDRFKNPSRSRSKTRNKTEKTKFDLKMKKNFNDRQTFVSFDVGTTTSRTDSTNKFFKIDTIWNETSRVFFLDPIRFDSIRFYCRDFRRTRRKLPESKLAEERASTYSEKFRDRFVDWYWKINENTFVLILELRRHWLKKRRTKRQISFWSEEKTSTWRFLRCVTPAKIPNWSEDLSMGDAVNSCKRCESISQSVIVVVWPWWFSNQVTNFSCDTTSSYWKRRKKTNSKRQNEKSNRDVLNQCV